jgi:hypothetical protein
VSRGEERREFVICVTCGLLGERLLRDCSRDVMTMMMNEREELINNFVNRGTFK